jgi:hypothetical protein
MQEPFEIWALVELMGHQKIAGKVTEHKFGNQSMVRVDVPEVPASESASGRPAFTKILSIGSLYAINPMTERDVRDYAAKLKAMPLDIFDLNGLFQERVNKLLSSGQLMRPIVEDTDDEEEYGEGPGF